ncbi:CBS domain-containing protein [Rhodobacterales bacterium HKCCE4037]|nr:CBS domain-containing protein [Rhodobacterales bacterium HKCCE4037]
MPLPVDLIRFLASVHPYDTLTEAELSALADKASVVDETAGTQLFTIGDDVEFLYLLVAGEVEILDESAAPLSLLGPRNSFGERAILRSEKASRTATVLADATMIRIPAPVLVDLIASHAAFAKFFDRSRRAQSKGRDLALVPVAEVMTREPVICPPDMSIRTAAALMHTRRISSVCVGGEPDFIGIATLRDLNGKVIVAGADPTAPLSSIMTEAPLALPPNALVTDVLHLMVERGIGHVPIVEEGRLVGIVTQTDLTRAQAMTSADLVGRVAKAGDATQMARVTAEIPQLLAQLIGSGSRHEVVTRLITDIADTATRRLLALAEEAFGPPPVPYLWLACGSQGRQEQTGVSDQDNCLILSDDVTEADMGYFEGLARFVCDGLNAIGYVYCPGDMMATNPRWRQPLRVWRGYFNGWIAKPNPEAQMLASVMFDLRPIGGDRSLFDGLHAETLKAASANSIFVAHMVSNSLKHYPPLGLLRGLATIRAGEHRNQIDMKHNGVVPVTDLGRIYALQGQLAAVNTRARLEAAIEAGVLSTSGGADLIDAYDLIATMRLEDQVTQIKAGQPPDNYLDPATLSDFERSHLRDAFVVVKTMQSAAGSGKGALS